MCDTLVGLQSSHLEHIWIVQVSSYIKAKSAVWSRSKSTGSSSSTCQFLSYLWKVLPQLPPLYSFILRDSQKLPPISVIRPLTFLVFFLMKSLMCLSSSINVASSIRPPGLIIGTLHFLKFSLRLCYSFVFESIAITMLTNNSTIFLPGFCTQASFLSH
jgi:hypothetical protein